MVYSLIKAGWVTGENFKEAFPNEKEYRHSLPEEANRCDWLRNRLKINSKKESLRRSRWTFPLPIFSSSTARA